MANSDYPGAVYIPCNNFFPDRYGASPSWVIIHGTGGGIRAQDTAAFFQRTENTANPASTNYIIGRDGTIVMCVHERDGAYGNGPLDQGCDSWWHNFANPNYVTISIEHCKPSSDNSDQLTDAQKQASFKLVADICKRNGIPARKADANGGITGHFSLEPIERHNCPGPYPWSELWAYLSGNSGSVEDGMLLHDSDDFFKAHFARVSPTRIHCAEKNKDIANALLNYYMSTGGSLRLPLSNEIALDPAKYPGVVIQIFESGIAVYDDKHIFDNPHLPGTCYLLKLDGGPGQAIIAKSLTDVLQTQVVDLQKKLAALGTTPEAMQLAHLQSNIAQALKILAS